MTTAQKIGWAIVGAVAAGALTLAIADTEITPAQGVSSGAGAVVARTPRMTLASDDPAVAALATLNTGLGTATTAAADGDANGSAIAHLRGINKKLAAGITVAGLTGTGMATAANQVLQRSDANALTTSPVTKAITIIAHTVGTPGTAVALAGSETLARKVYLCATRAAAANSAVVYIGTSAVKNDTARQISLAPADVFVLDPGPGCVVDLAAVYLDGSGANDGVRGWYVPK